MYRARSASRAAIAAPAISKSLKSSRAHRHAGVGHFRPQWRGEIDQSHPGTRLQTRQRCLPRRAARPPWRRTPYCLRHSQQGSGAPCAACAERCARRTVRDSQRSNRSRIRRRITFDIWGNYGSAGGARQPPGGVAHKGSPSGRRPPSAESGYVDAGRRQVGSRRGRGSPVVTGRGPLPPCRHCAAQGFRSAI